LRRRQAQRRRRDVLIAILAGAAGSFILAAVLGVSMMWPVQVLFDVMLVAYIALLVRMRNLALEREAKLTYLRERGRVARARIPSSRDAYEFGTPGYDLDFRRAAN
jgi:hypothetical protein